MIVAGQQSCFDDETLAAMIVAYDRVCRALQPSGITATDRETIGRQIIEAAKQGERDPNALRQQALKALGIEEASIAA